MCFVFQALATKTKDLIDKVRLLRQTTTPFTVEGLKAIEPPLPPHMASLVFALAVAEGVA